eukprot:COSAG01_NODE_6021_length_3898_cov_35.243485_3_plen_72_part_00
MPAQLSTELTNQLQLRVVREAGLPDEAVELLRSAQYQHFRPSSSRNRDTSVLSQKCRLLLTARFVSTVDTS